MSSPRSADPSLSFTWRYSISSELHCETQELLQFVHRHIDSVRVVILDAVVFSDPVPGPRDFRSFLREVRNHLNLSILLMNYVWSIAGHIWFPGLGKVISFEEPNEDGYIDIAFLRGVRLKTREQIRAQVPRMLSSICYKDWCSTAHQTSEAVNDPLRDREDQIIRVWRVERQHVQYQRKGRSEVSCRTKPLSICSEPIPQ